jgi:hypothetical protein
VSGDDVLFWERMASLDPLLDRADMTASVAFPRPMPFVELIISTPAGKPVYHFSHGYLPVVAPELDSTLETFQRPRQDLLALCAMAVAFAGIAPDVSHVRTQAGALFFASTHSLYVAVAAADSRFSVPILASLARLTVAFVTAVLSANLVTALSNRPNIDIAPHLEPYTSYLSGLLRRALAHPLPYATLSPPSLPCPTSPSSRSSIVELLRSSIAKASPLVSHGIVMTASPPLPRKLIAVAAPHGSPLTPLDIHILTSIPPEPVTADQNDAGQGEESTNLELIYLQSTGHIIPYLVTHIFVELKLRADDYDVFNEAVGGNDWRPEWSARGGDIVSVLVCAKAGLQKEENSSRAAAAACIRDIERRLSGARAVRDIIVAMERPLDISDVPGVSIAGKSVFLKSLVVFSRERLAATIGGTDHAIGEALVDALFAPGDVSKSQYVNVRSFASALRSSSLTRTSTLGRGRKLLGVVDNNVDGGVWCVLDHSRGLWIVGVRKLVVAAFTLESDLDEAIRLFCDDIVPWSKKFERSLISEFDRIAVFPRRILGDFLTPFPS